jgi:hypothetical protein
VFWPGHTPELISAVDAWALQLSPAWAPEKRLRRWIWRRAFELHHTAGAASKVYREHMPFSPLAMVVARCSRAATSTAVARRMRACLRDFLEPAAKPPRGLYPGSVKASSPQLSSQAPAAFPGKAALSNIPIRVPLLFMGRDDALTAIEAALKRYEGRVAITALHGLRGVGKTTLAAAYAERHRGDYRATWWIRAQAKSTMRADLVALGIRLGWVGVDDKEEMAVESVIERWRHEGEGLLLIFDNAVDANALNAYLPRGGAAKVLVTSRAP